MFFFLVREAGVEPARPCEHWHLKPASLPIPPLAHPYLANWEPEKAYTMTAKLVNAGVDAIFCMSDWMAGGVYNCIHDMGLEVGKDIAVTGFDNEKVANWYIPKMTSSRLPLLEVGTESARLLFEKIEKQDSDDNGADSDTVKHIKIPCEIKIRESVPKRNE